MTDKPQTLTQEADMNEKDEAISLANKILDSHWRDPDDVLSILSRNFLRSQEIIANLEQRISDARRMMALHQQEIADARIEIMAGRSIRDELDKDNAQLRALLDGARAKFREKK